MTSSTPAPGVGAYYNENDPFAAAWLRSLIAAGEIAPGIVDERDIRDVKGADLEGFTQHHFFAGIGGWSHALRLAGWPDDRAVWTGSCPCQPWSIGNNGKQKGEQDDRHLWPAMFGLVAKFEPAELFGEQVDGPDAERWFDGVASDLEGIGYAVASTVLPACGFGAVHRRYRRFLVADAVRARWSRHQHIKRIPQSTSSSFAKYGDALADARVLLAGDPSGLLPLDGISVAMARSIVKGFGNAIVPQVAAEFIRAYCEVAGIALHEGSVACA